MKGELHHRNKHRGQYDMRALIKSNPELEQYVELNKYGTLSINFFDSAAVLELNKALLKHYYKIDYWSLPKGALTPPIPSRADYIHYMADIVGKGARCLDIGEGANCIYPILGIAEYGWSFVGSDTELKSLDNARLIVEKNSLNVELRHQGNRTKIFEGIIKSTDRFTLTVCNPPFHDSPKSAREASLRKLSNLKGTKIKQTNLNFGGNANELWCEGGEKAFITQMIQESVKYRDNVKWFSTLVSKQENLKDLKQELKKHKASNVQVINLSQGNKKSRILVWHIS